jgi:uncharacterized membrane protein HdeD (DUF308 family)
MSNPQCYALPYDPASPMQFRIPLASAPADTAGRAQFWELALLRALAALVLAGVAVTRPMFETLSWLLAAYLLVDGLAAFVTGVHLAWRDGDGAELMLEGLSSLAACLAICVGTTDLIAQELTAVMALWGIFSGLFLLQAAARQQRDEPGRGFTITAGLTLMLWGAVLASQPSKAMELWLALLLYAVAFGLPMGALTWRLWQDAPRQGKPSKALTVSR